MVAKALMAAMVFSMGHAGLKVQENWRLGVQAWSFHKYTFYEAVDKTAQLGLSYIEAFPGQQLCKEHPGVVFGPGMSEAIRNEVKAKLKAAGIKLVNFGVVGMPRDEAGARRIFDFARDMGIETIVAEPSEDSFDMLDRLCQEYDINLAIHNHPRPSHYWNPDTVLKVCKGRSRRIGACADIGHWMRSGINPLDALKKLRGRIIMLHFKDLNEFGVKSAHDVPWGTGKANVKALLAELARQNFKGVFSVEYEYHWTNSMPEISQSIKYFDKVAANLGQAGWRWLFNGQNLDGWDCKSNAWKINNKGELCVDKGGDLWTKEKFGNFILDLEFKVDKGSNSGVFLRAGDHNWLPWAEVQILDSYGKKKVDKHDCGGIFDCLAPAKNAVKKPGQWNHYTITCQGSKIYVVLNGVLVVNMDLNKWVKAHENPDGTRNKFDVAFKDLPRKGFIGLQYHESPVWFRNIKIKLLGDNK